MKLFIETALHWHGAVNRALRNWAGASPSVHGSEGAVPDPLILLKAIAQQLRRARLFIHGHFRSVDNRVDQQGMWRDTFSTPFALESVQTDHRMS